MAFRSAALATLLLVATGPASAQTAPPHSLAEAVASPVRSPSLVARDAARHPQAELEFFGITPSSNVVEIWPGGGYWTEILAPYLHDHGTYHVALGDAEGDRTEAAFARIPTRLAEKIKAEPALFDHIRFTELAHGHDVIAPPGTADVVLTFRNLHNWMAADDATEMLDAIHAALKPGGILGIEDHRARPDQKQDPQAADGYVRQDYAIALIENAGFKLVGSSEIDANPRDTTHWPKGVWTLPPSYALGTQDHDRYAAVGEADNFVLKFRKLGR
ncbi:putative methyltransferase [Endobacter medicaginis]|uniref:Class I SAM-dependent methyltransferase n=1 Tax=Endobacter medicaginis TaxID=1181271 RepID=A0A839V0A9_9PROT|nr:class I SAM-dependent methyltransferase [Endobacter medicaginis]MBB3174285.1 putative methyltransferase [Endobacter medicaginis]MCX5476168.1 class I SAM-dependent methyltransferase [Endobacter medicaginis]NVN31703.1 class I SAM-dependent methyltransferase [Endobacter medicaginis]